MTDDEIKALIQDCSAAIAREWSSLELAPTPEDLLKLAEEALRFRHITRNAEHLPDPEPYPGQPTRWGWSVQWGAWGDQNTSLREAIDQDRKGEA
jgi:hypothetical protein